MSPVQEVRLLWGLQHSQRRSLERMMRREEGERLKKREQEGAGRRVRVAVTRPPFTTGTTPEGGGRREEGAFSHKFVVNTSFQYK